MQKQQKTAKQEQNRNRGLNQTITFGEANSVFSSVLLCTILAVLQEQNFQVILLATADVL